jgi:hypothetical protein
MGTFITVESPKYNVAGVLPLSQVLSLETLATFRNAVSFAFAVPSICKMTPALAGAAAANAKSVKRHTRNDRRVFFPNSMFKLIPPNLMIL